MTYVSALFRDTTPIRGGMCARRDGLGGHTGPPLREWADTQVRPYVYPARYFRTWDLGRVGGVDIGDIDDNR
jgi:hypothetical protein